MPTKYNFLNIRSRHPSHNILRRRVLVPDGISAVLRLGSTTEVDANIQLNTVESIRNSADKLKMKQLFLDAGVSSPIFYTVDNVHEHSFDAPLLAKRSFRSRGAGMQKLDTVEQLDAFLAENINDNRYNKLNPYYFERFYNYTKEYRIHVSCCGGYFYANRKMLKEDADERWFRNSKNSVWMLESNPLFDKPETWDVIVEDCQRAREALGLTICGFDVKVNKKGNHMILEANSACSFGDNEKTSIVSTKYQLELCRCIQQSIMAIT